MMTNKEIKQRHFDKVYKNAAEIPCGCGCGVRIKSKDKYGRDKKFISGHNNRKYDDPTQYKREWNHRNRDSRYKYKRKYIRNRKLKLIEFSNNRCMDCPYKFDGTNERVFDFHHRNPKLKLFGLSQSGLNRYSWSAILIEHAKCDLLCSNCHRLRHNSV